MVGYTVAVAFLSVLPATAEPTGLTILFTSGAVVAVVGSAFIFQSIRANVADPDTVAGRRYYRRLAVVFAVLLAISITLSTIGSIVRQAPAWHPIVIAALTIVATAAPIVAAEHYRRGLRAHEEATAEWQDPPRERARAFRRMGITFAIAAASTAAVLVVLQLTLVFDRFSILDTVLFSLGLGAFSAMVPALATMWSSSAAINRIFGSDIESRTLVGKAVMRRRAADLADEQSAQAARFASITRNVMPVQLAQSGFLLTGLLLGQTPLLLRSDDPLLVSLFAALGVLFVAALIIGYRQYRLVRAYSAAHPVDSVPGKNPSVEAR